MAVQTVFKRYELKYILTKRQKQRLITILEPYMKLDKYGRTSIRNIYYDTDTYRLIRRSIEKPVYKEKLRVRSYGKVNDKDDVFVELKKKYKSVVYKRRMTMPFNTATALLNGNDPFPQQTQIAREIEYFRDYYENLKPAVFLSYDREAFYSVGGDDFRITFDESILYRTKELSLTADVWGTAVLPGDLTLLEIKTSGGIPLWMTKFLTSENLYKGSFSKYGSAYADILKNNKGVLLYA